MTQIKYNAPWHPLKHACVGRTYGPGFYDPIKDIETRESLQKIARETEEDYVHLIKVLEGFGVKVDRPKIDDTKTIMDHVNDQGQLNYQSTNSYTLIPRPPMQARDSFLVVGEKILATNDEISWFEPTIKSLSESSYIKPWDRNDSWMLSQQQKFDAPLATVIGDTIILDCRDHPWLHDYFVQVFPEYKIVPVMIGGHNDAVYCVPKPGLIVSTYHHENYLETFPNWKVKFIENQSWNAIPDWRRLKHSNAGRWWSPESENNPNFSGFVNTWLNHWLGFVEETVFDVNMLQIDERTVLVNNYNRDLFEFFRQHDIEPIISPFRHRFFWDGGIHCITNDFYREGPRDRYI